MKARGTEKHPIPLPASPLTGEENPPVCRLTFGDDFGGVS
jgi:hypothetical protein